MMLTLKEEVSSAMAKYNGKNALLPPKSPFPSISPSYAEYIPTSAIGSKTLSKPRNGNSQHQRTSSESFLIEEQPSWLDELLDEPDTPVQRGGHRRSSSDSFAYTDFTNVGSMNYIARYDNKYNKITPVSSWGSQDFAIYRDSLQNTSHTDLNPSGKTKNKPPAVAPLGLPSPRGNNVKSFSTSKDTDRNHSLSTEKQDVALSVPQDPKSSTEKKDSFHAKPSETETKRAKQQFAQRSRVRKLQYIAELERNVQALQVEGCEVSAQLKFLNQQSLILSMENKTLKQRLESLAQEQLIKYLEHEVLEREVGRLRSMFQQQQQQQHTPSTHRRDKSRDLDQQFSKLSLKLNEATTAGHDSVHM